MSDGFRVVPEELRRGGDGFRGMADRLGPVVSASGAVDEKAMAAGAAWGAVAEFAVVAREWTEHLGGVRQRLEAAGYSLGAAADRYVETDDAIGDRLRGAGPKGP